MKLKSLAIGLISILIIAAAAWLGASIFIGRTTSQTIETLVAKPLNPKAPIRLVEHKHEQGLFSSKGQFEIRFNNIPIDADSGKQVFALLVTYQVNNLLLPESMMRFEWLAKPSGEAGKEIDRLFGKEINLNGKGKLGYGGKALTSLKMPELVMNNGKDKLQITPSNGSASWQDQKLNFEWKTDRIALVSDSSSYEIEGIKLATDIQNRQKGLATIEFGVDKLSSKELTIAGYKFNSNTTERGDRLDFIMNQKLDSISAANEKISNVVIDFTMTGLDAASIVQLTNVIEESSDQVQNWTDSDKQLAIKLSRNIIDKGFKMSIPKLYAEYGKGSLNGSLELEVLKSESAQDSFDIAKSVRASGQLLGNGKLLDQSQKAMILMMGIARDTKEGLKASFEYANNKLTVNGKTQNISDGVATANAVINELLYK